MDGAERELFVAAVQRATAISGGGAALDAALRELGWLDALALDPSTAVPVLFEQQGMGGVTSSALDWLLAWALGAAQVAVVLPALRGTEAPGKGQGGSCSVQGLGTSALARAEKATVVVADGGAFTGWKVSVAALDRRPVGGMDPALGLIEVSGRFDAGADAVVEAEVDWSRAVAFGQVALGYELVGVGRAMLELACEHARTREQFGRPIAGFQAVRHRLAESYVALEGAAALLGTVWDDPSALLAVSALAKSGAGRAARTTARHCQQVLAGLGFTAEHPLHRLVRRALVLDQLLGTSSVLRRELGSEVVRTGVLPPSASL